MSGWNSDPGRPPHTLRFALGEIAIICKRSDKYEDSYTGTPCEVVQVGPFPVRGVEFYDYIVQLCDSTVVAIDDEYMKKFEPPADGIDIAETEELEETV